MKELLKIFFLSALFVRLIFWIGGIDFFERSVDAGFALTISILVGASLTAFIYSIKEN